MRRDVFQAIADPVRRSIIQLVATEQLNVNALANHFDISRPAISKHIRILETCGLIQMRQQGRERFCEPNLQQLREVAAWTNQYRRFWESKLDSLDEYLQRSNDTDKNRKPLK